MATTMTIVSTRSGAVGGSAADDVRTFKGIPYAAPPFGANRLLPPQPVEPWTGVRGALAFGAEPPQPRFLAELLFDPTAVGEDCLNLNVWAAKGRASGLPVMVWIPGGMFEVGTGASYDGSRFARDGVVCVTINYRVGPEGFLFVPDGDANLGLRDQIAALEWVRDNIAAFGGDPANVTIFGESAGAMSVSALLAVPRAEGLFRRAIIQSGADRVISATSAERVGQFLAERLDVEPTRAAIATVPPQRVLTAAAALKADLLADPDPERWGLDVVSTTLPWQPVVDGALLPGGPNERVARGASADVAIIAGSNTEDWRLFAVIGGAIDDETDDALTGPVAEHGYRAAATYGLSEDVLAGYRAAHPAASPGDLLAAIQTDWWCRMPAIRLADAHARRRGGTWMYEFAWPSPTLGGRLGACHGLEIPFVFDTLDKGADQMVGEALGDHPPQPLATAMHDAWASFARSGDPGWPRYDVDRRATMRFDTASEVVDDPRAVERALWSGIR